MKQDIKKCSVQYLKNVFSQLDNYKGYVFWIRNHDMSQQIYVSENYKKIWDRDSGILYDIPLLWLEYLAKEKKNDFMQQLQARHMHGYQDPQKNLILYQIETPNYELSNLKDQCYKCANKSGEQFIVGVSKQIKLEIWHIEFESQSYKLNSIDNKIHQEFLILLENNFGIREIKLHDQKLSTEIPLKQFFINKENVKFSNRELDCLYHLCQGKTAKQTARDLSISYRTVETHIENIRSKTKAANKLEIISRYAQHFLDQ